MSTLRTPLPRRRLLLGVPAILVAATLAPRPASAATAGRKPKVFECAADLLQAS